MFIRGYNAAMQVPTNIRPWQLRRAVQALKAGGVVAYPTEAVYGLGCDPLNAAAVLDILDLKQRPMHKGLILIASEFAQLEPWLEPLPAARRTAILQSWPGPNTWVWPVSDAIPVWLRGQHHSLAVRVTAHPVARSLCAAFGGPIVSTSANPAGLHPARTPLRVRHYFGASLDVIVHGPCGRQRTPTVIRDAASGEVLRPA